MQKTPEPLTPEASSELVASTVVKANELIIGATEGLSPRSRWTLTSRIVIGIFQHHFSLSLMTAAGEMKKRAEAEAKTLPPGSCL